MALRKLASMTDEELGFALAQRVAEANIIYRAVLLRGVVISLDLVERKQPEYPQGFTEIVLQTGAR